MWPFNIFNKKETQVLNDGISPSKLIPQGEDKLKEFKKIGETFYYLGRTCVVTSHSAFYPSLGFIPELVFDYADENGVIHSRAANIMELPALINQDNLGKLALR